jgi:hypothetical protein
MVRTYGTFMAAVWLQRVKTRCYKMFRADGPFKKDGKITVRGVAPKGIVTTDFSPLHLRTRR